MSENSRSPVAYQPPEALPPPKLPPPPEKPLQAIGPGEISENEKHKDRDLVRGIPEILAKNGFTVVKTRAGDPGGK